LNQYTWIRLDPSNPMVIRMMISQIAFLLIA
jgi:hypothetical protein